MKHLFIRFKDIPPNEISGVYDGDCGKIRDEIGTSCYQFIRDGENFKIVLSSLDLGFLYDLIGFIEDFRNGNIPAYLIAADQVGLGSYGEPVVKNIKILKELTCVELEVPAPKIKTDITNTQIQYL
jgi:hypothetical protein